MTDKEIIDRAKDAEKRTGFGELVHSPISKGVNSAYGIGFIEGMVEYRNFLQDSASKDLEKAAKRYATEGDEISGLYIIDEEVEAFKAGAKWQKEQMLKDATECEVKVDASGYPYIDRCIELYDYDKDIPLAKEGDKVNIVVIKGE